MRAKLGDGVMACGNATKDAEYNRLGEKNTPNCKWGMAVGKDKDDNTVFANCEAWGRDSSRTWIPVTCPSNITKMYKYAVEQGRQNKRKGYILMPEVAAASDYYIKR